MPLVSRTFDQLIDFTRTSAATYVDASGRIVPTPASRNLLTFTQEFDNAAWTKVNASVTPNTVVAPDGTTTADTLTATANGGYINGNWSSSASGDKINSIWIKRRTGTGAVYLYRPDGAAFATINPTSDWVRYSSATITGSPTNLIVQLQTNGDQIDIWGAQGEVSSTATDYTRNNGGVYPPRFDYDPVTLAPKGLLVEEQRTNLLTYSEQFDNTTGWPTATNVTVTANSTTSPDGAANADTIDDGTTASVQHRLYRSYTFTAAAHTLSIYAKAGTGAWFQLIVNDGTTSFYANFNASTGATGSRHASATSTITNVGNGWYRCTMTATTLAAVGNVQIGMLDTDQGSALPSYTGANRTLFFYGAQLEAGSFATSYIPTVASQVTRTADVATITGANFSQWFNAAEGSFVVECDVGSPAAFPVALGYNTANTASFVFINPTGVGTWSGSVELARGGLTFTNGVLFKAAMAYSASGRAVTTSNLAPVTDANLIGTADMLSLGKPANNNSQLLNGHIRSIRYYPTRLSNAQLQALTA